MASRIEDVAADTANSDSHATNTTPIANHARPQLHSRWSDDSTNPSITSVPSQASAASFTSAKPKKSKSNWIKVLAIKEPSTAAFEQYAKQQRAEVELRGFSSPSGQRLSQQKMPDHVPKVNSKWDGLPKSAHLRARSSPKGSTDSTKSRGIWSRGTTSQSSQRSRAATDTGQAVAGTYSPRPPSSPLSPRGSGLPSSLRSSPTTYHIFPKRHRPSSTKSSLSPSPTVQVDTPPSPLDTNAAAPIKEAPGSDNASATVDSTPPTQAIAAPAKVCAQTPEELSNDGLGRVTVDNEDASSTASEKSLYPPENKARPNMQQFDFGFGTDGMSESDKSRASSASDQSGEHSNRTSVESASSAPSYRQPQKDTRASTPSPPSSPHSFTQHRRATSLSPRNFARPFNPHTESDTAPASIPRSQKSLSGKRSRSNTSNAFPTSSTYRKPLAQMIGQPITKDFTLAPISEVDTASVFTMASRRDSHIPELPAFEDVPVRGLVHGDDTETTTLDSEDDAMSDDTIEAPPVPPKSQPAKPNQILRMSAFLDDDSDTGSGQQEEDNTDEEEVPSSGPTHSQLAILSGKGQLNNARVVPYVPEKWYLSSQQRLGVDGNTASREYEAVSGETEQREHDHSPPYIGSRRSHEEVRANLAQEMEHWDRERQYKENWASDLVAK